MKKLRAKAVVATARTKGAVIASLVMQMDEFIEERGIKRKNIVEYNTMVNVNSMGQFDGEIFMVYFAKKQPKRVSTNRRGMDQKTCVRWENNC